jgi:hypothetical protein
VVDRTGYLRCLPQLLAEVESSTGQFDAGDVAKVRTGNTAAGRLEFKELTLRFAVQR